MASNMFVVAQLAFLLVLCVAYFGAARAEPLLDKSWFLGGEKKTAPQSDLIAWHKKLKASVDKVDKKAVTKAELKSMQDCIPGSVEGALSATIVAGQHFKCVVQRRNISISEGTKAAKQVGNCMCSK